MVYTFGCSMSKWYWPTWVDWLRVYDQPVTNLANKGYGNQNIYWNILNNIKKIKSSDHINIMWAENHRIGLWYDKDWIDQKQVLGFFPDTAGKLWFSQKEPYMGLYRTHPDLYTSFTNMIVDMLQTIFQTQLLLNKIGCSYTMHTSKNLWCDGRPIFFPKYQTVFDSKNDISADEIQTAKKIMDLPPIKNLINEINWDRFLDSPADPFNPADYTGIWEYFINNKEYVILKHNVDQHPNPLAHHDYALEKVMKQDPLKGKYRDLAKQISQETMTMPIPEFSANDFVIDPEGELLDHKYKLMLENL